MQQLIKQIGNKYQNQIKSISQASATELNILLNDDVNLDQFSQNLQNHLVEFIDELIIVKINIVDAKGNIRDTFPTLQ